MKFEVKTYSSTSSLLGSILFFLLGAVLYAYPDAVVAVVSKVFGGCIVAFGVYSCIKNYLDLRKDSTTPAYEMLLGLVSIAIGLVFILCASGISYLLRFIAGGYILFVGINRLISALYLPRKGSAFWSLLIVAILLISVGIGTILYANLTVSYIGIVIMVYSVLDVIGYIFHKRSDSLDTSKTKPKKKNKKNEVVEAVVVEDKTTNKNNKKKKK